MKNSEKINKTIVRLKDGCPFPLKKRPSDTHKGNFGHSLIVAGSSNFCGAAIIASKSAMKIGSGLTTCAYPKSCGVSFAAVPEVMTLAIDCGEYFSGDGAQLINFINEKASVFLIGNGLGTAEETQILVKNILKNTKKPCVVDADGINALKLSDMEYIAGRAILTPHLKEFSRLSGLTIDEINSNIVEIACEFAKKYKITLVLKSHETIVASYEENNIYICDYGSPALAKGGSGDCLAGIIVGLLAQKYSPTEAAVLGNFIMGRAAKLALEKEHEMTLSASDIIDRFGNTLNEI